MKTPETTTVFAGVDDRTDADLPTWYAQRKTADSPVSFAEAIRTVPRAVETTVAYTNPYTDEWIPTNRFNAVVDPERLDRQARGEETDPLFHVPTDSYSIINPVEVYGPLEDVLREESLDGHPLGDVVFGEIRQYRGGGEVHMDVLFDGLSVTLPGRSEPITMGVTSGYDFFGGHAVYVEGFARDSYCANSIRQLTDRETVKHVGDVSDFQGWWEGILGQLGLVADDLLAFIEDAGNITVDFTEVPFDVSEFYELLGFPSYLADRAANDARAEAPDPFDIDMWTLHSGATYALTHFFTGKEGAALDGYVRTANDILFNPEATIRAVERNYEQRANADTDGDGQTGLESQVALAQIERVGRDVREKATQFETREATLRDRFASAQE
ncbi:hypothetical protein [Haloarcula nitratireducens]|uniref:Uncharacterized protein n=1 Tax=Haloarcula nitratireducens TaxID=2487749 RepID=A0AAW4PHP6_9EURY|nr:hypothetical protein [Halomicroarcula nitratireducens]MBX0296712.1 hypothetical protein [Halomicroarcula nitratireducens]